MNNNTENQQYDIQYLTPRFIIRSPTNNNERAKQYFIVAKTENCVESLIIRKLVLSENLKLYGDSFKILKQFKNYYLFEEKFSIKIETLKQVITTITNFKII